MFTVLFAPHYFPLLCLLVLMGFSYMRSFPINYKIFVLALVYILTIAMPLMLTALYRKVSGMSHHQMSKRESRFVPYLIGIACYFLCFHIMTVLIVPHFIVSVVVAAIFVQIICLIINSWHKISTHSAAAGAMNGALIAFSFIFGFDPVWWLCATLIIAGCVGTSRLILRRHTLSEVNIGLAVGFITGLVSILLL